MQLQDLKFKLLSQIIIFNDTVIRQLEIWFDS